MSRTKPQCTLNAKDRAAVDVLFMVARTLREAKLDQQLDGFLDRAQDCQTYEKMMALAKEYVTIENERGS